MTRRKGGTGGNDERHSEDTCSSRLYTASVERKKKPKGTESSLIILVGGAMNIGYEVKDKQQVIKWSHFQTTKQSGNETTNCGGAIPDDT